MIKYGYVRVCAAVPELKPADVDYNKTRIIAEILKADGEGVDVMTFPELCITGYTCGDLFNQPDLVEAAGRALLEIADATRECRLLCALGAPALVRGRLYNCAFVISGGAILGAVPKIHIPNYGEFYEKRWFNSGMELSGAEIKIGDSQVVVDPKIIFNFGGVNVGIEICEDLWVPVPPSCALSQNGADIILNLSASPAQVGKHDYQVALVSQQSARCRCGYVYASAGWGESSTDLVFAGNAIIASDGGVRDSGKNFFKRSTLFVDDIDIEKLRNDRCKFSTFFDGVPKEMSYRFVDAMTERREPVDFPLEADPHPFVPSDPAHLDERCEEIVNIQARGLMQRLNAIWCRNAVIGISGGLDSTLALLVAVRAFDMLGLDRKGIVGITMPGMATTSRTKNNAVGLMEELGVTALEIPIGKAVGQHFEDIGQDPERYDVTFENSQARERTQILMDYANKINAIVIGTGDMSELALGWCTYNGDHMSMYGVNASVPKTLVRHLVKWFASETRQREAEILLDIVDTPISPELVPSGSDKIGQITEDVVGPYELHDFFMYHLLRNSFGPRKIFWLAGKAFGEKYDNATILKWLRNFYRRFFNQQFKRSCMPDGPKVGSVCLSPRGDWRMPSDASSKLWLSEIDEIEAENDRGE